MEDQETRMRKIFEEVAHERKQQIEVKGYPPTHDKWHTPRDFVKYANQRFTKLTRNRTEWFSRQSFIEAIAVLVAAVEAMDIREEKRNEQS